MGHSTCQHIQKYLVYNWNWKCHTKNCMAPLVSLSASVVQATDQCSEMCRKLTGFFQVPVMRQVLVRLDPRKNSADCNHIKDEKGVTGSWRKELKLPFKLERKRLEVSLWHQYEYNRAKGNLPAPTPSFGFTSTESSDIIIPCAAHKTGAPCTYTDRQGNSNRIQIPGNWPW